MVSHQPVPSRAALNALRGLILTTSCSVVLLAEERRRRLQIARTAIENARKLHLLQNNRGPTALTEVYGNWSSPSIATDDDVLPTASFPRPRTSTRRRGRAQLIGIGRAEESCEDYVWSLQPIARAENYNEPTEPSCVNGVDMIRFDKSISAFSRSKRPQYWRWKAPQRILRPAFSTHAVYPAESDVRSIEKEADVVLTGINSHETAIPGEEWVQNSHPVEAAQHYLQKAEHGDLDPERCYDVAVPVLERLLGDLEVSNAGENVHSEMSSLARRILDMLASSRPRRQKTAKQVQRQAIRLFRIVSECSPQDITVTLSSILTLTKDPLKLLVYLTIVLQNSSHCNSLRDVLLFLSQDCKPCPWAHGNLVHDLLFQHALCESGFSQIRQLYLALQEFGLFNDIEVPQHVEYRIRKLMVVLAWRAEEDCFANSELEKLERIASEDSTSDFHLQKHIIVRLACSGKWDEVSSQIGTLRDKVDTQCLGYQKLVAKTTDIFVAQSRNNDELEAFLRQAVTDFKLKLKPRWFYAVLNGYAGRRQADLVFPWLDFCRSSGLSVNTSFNQRLLVTCRKYWSFSPKTVQSLQKRLGHSQGSAASESAGITPDAGFKPSTTPASLLRQAVLEKLESESPGTQGAKSLISSAYEKGCDVSQALTPLLLVQLKEGEDPSQLVKDVLQMGIRIQDSTYNKAAQALSAGGNHRAAAQMCEVAARENGNGQLLYNQYNFSNLVFAYTGIASYTALRSVLSAFTSEIQWWHGSRTCKESIKLAMKTIAMRAVADGQDGELHRQALDQLDKALLHVKRCRPTKDERHAVLKAFVGFAGALPPKGSDKSSFRTKKESGHAVQDACTPDARNADDDAVRSVASASGWLYFN